MKRDTWIACLEGAVLAFLVSFAGCMCLLTGFGMTARIETLVLCCVLSAVFSALCYSTKLGFLPLVVFVLGTILLWRADALAISLERLVYGISCTYDQAYGLGVLYWSPVAPVGSDVTWALCAGGYLIALVTTWTVCRRNPAVLAVLAAMLPLSLCLVVTDRVPQVIYLFLLMLGLAVLILSQTVRNKNTAQGNALTLMLVIPVLLALLVLFLAIPQDTYDGQARADRILLQVETWLQQVGGQGTSAPAEQQVDLSDAGQLLSLHTPVMSVKADSSRTLYLREQGFQMYNGNTWYNESADNPYDWMRWELLSDGGHVEITTRNLHLMQFVPYYAKPDDDPMHFSPTHGMVENRYMLYSYSFTLQQLKNETVSTPVDSESFEQTQVHLELPMGTLQPDVLSLPASTVQWAEPLAQSLVKGKKTVREQALAIADYVRGSADYSRGTGRMPANERDFARWFLEESDTGYCVHFATATTVLLRAAGIHAQYVTGYMVKTEAGQSTVVYQDQAHAWVEYYDPAVGWRVLESTPAEGLPVMTTVQQSGGTESTAPTQQEETQQTQPPEETTAPTQPQQPARSGQLWNVLYGILGVLFAVLLVIGQWQLRLKLREKRLHTGTTNARAIACWQEVVRLSRLTKERPEPGLFATAQKAKFSQHILTEAELTPFLQSIRQSKRKLRHKPWYLQPLYHIIFAIY